MAFSAMQGFDQMVTLTGFWGYLYCLQSDLWWQKLQAISKSYILLCNRGGRFELTIFTTF